MAEIQENHPLHPLHRVDVFPFPVQDDYELSKERALQLLKRVVSNEEWKFFEKKGILKIKGRRGVFVIYPSNQTEIIDHKTGQCVARACLQLSVPAPVYDRMAAEYLLLKNDEALYWKTANIFWCRGCELDAVSSFLVTFNICLYFFVLWQLLDLTLCIDCF